MLIGAHVSVAGGLANAFDRGESLGCTAIQIFSKNQMQWNAAPLEKAAIDAFLARFQISPIESVMIHDSYLINLGSPDNTNLEKSRAAFVDEIIRAELLAVPYLVFHPGSHLGTGDDAGLRTIIDSLNWALDKSTDAEVVLLIENTAGQGTNLGYRFEHLAILMDGVEQKHRIGVCLDTAHTFAAGYDIRTSGSFNQVINEFDDIVGLDMLKAIHLNDSKKALASRVDRHDNIGEGEIGLEAFRFLMTDKRFSAIPMTLETPGGDSWFRKNLELLKSMQSKK